MPDPKPCTPDEAAALFERVDRLSIPLGPGQPRLLLEALGRRDDWEDLQVVGAMLIDAFPVFAQSGVRMRSGFFGPAERALRAAGHNVCFVPGDFRRFESIARGFGARIVAAAGSPPDSEGRISLSLFAGTNVSELNEAIRDPKRQVLIETSARFPRTLGLPPEHPHSIALADVDIWIEGDAAPMELPEAVPSEVETAIAANVAPYIESGATLQTGIGAVPSMVVEILANGEGGDYGVHSEMFTTGLMRLHEAGKVTNRHKGIYDGISIATFAMGSRPLYDWLHECEEVRFLPVQIVNDPAVIGRNRKMISINGALSIDLFGQIVADSIDGAQYSGIGGHEDFLAGTGLAPDGRSLLCLPSSSMVKGEPLSRIVPQLRPGSIVTSPRHQVDVVVTEFGAAELAGRSVEERAVALAEIARPDVRDALRDAAREIGRLGVKT
jgi:acyl-CoA hydrolase